MKIEKDKSIKISENCYICYIPTNEEKSKYVYALCVNNKPEYLDYHGYEIYGYGESMEEALLMAVGELTQAALKGICIDDLHGEDVLDFMKRVINKKGDICSPDVRLTFTYKEDDKPKKTSIRVNIEGNDCVPLFDRFIIC